MRKAGTSKSFKNGVHNQRLLTKADDPFLAPIVQTHCSRQRFSSVQLLTGKSLRNELSMTTIHQEPKWPEQDDVEYPDDDVKRLCRLKKKKPESSFLCCSQEIRWVFSAQSPNRTSRKHQLQCSFISCAIQIKLCSQSENRKEHEQWSTVTGTMTTVIPWLSSGHGVRVPRFECQVRLPGETDLW